MLVIVRTLRERVSSIYFRSDARSYTDSCVSSNCTQRIQCRCDRTRDLLFGRWQIRPFPAALVQLGFTRSRDAGNDPTARRENAVQDAPRL